MRLTPAEELADRIAKLQQKMAEASLEAALILQNADLFYFTGSIQQGVLYVPVEGEPVYMVRKEAGRARMESGLAEVRSLTSLREIPSLLSDYDLPLPGKAGMELDVLPVAHFRRFEKLLPDCTFVDVTPLIREVRAVKSDYEIAIMKDAALQVDRVYRHACGAIKEGMTDLELAAELEFFARREGHQGITRMRGFNSELFYGHIFSGPDSAAPAFLDAPLGGLGVNPSIGQGASYKRIARHEPIIVDFAGAFDGYLVDQTRTLAIGELPTKLHTAYQDMLRIQARLKELARPGVSWGHLYDECYGLALELGYRDHFMGASGAQVSFIGHGIGVEIDEYPFIARGFSEPVLEKNMCFAFEPKAVYPGMGSVGIENTFWVAEEGLKNLTFSDETLVIL